MTDHTNGSGAIAIVLVIGFVVAVAGANALVNYMAPRVSDALAHLLQF